MNEVIHDAGPDTPREDSKPAQAPERVFITWNKKQFEVVCTQYVDNQNTCIVLLDPKSGQVEAKASANLAQLPAHQVYIKDYSENRGIAEILTTRHLIRKVGTSIRNGSEEFELYEILPKLGKHFGINLPDSPTLPVLDPGLTQISEVDPIPAPAPADDSPVNMSEFDAQQSANLVQRAKDARAEEDAIAEDLKTDPPTAA